MKQIGNLEMLIKHYQMYMYDDDCDTPKAIELDAFNIAHHCGHSNQQQP